MLADTDLIRCPGCKFIGTTEDFDVLGADPDNLMCSVCGDEFPGADNVLWSRCNRCNAIRGGVGRCQACGCPEYRLERSADVQKELL